MKILLKNDLPHIEDEGVIWELGYASLDEQERLEILKYDAFGGRYYINQPENEQSIDIARYLRYKREFIRVHLRGWKGLDETIETDHMNRICERQLLILTRDEEQLEYLYQLFRKHLEFSESDKKK